MPGSPPDGGSGRPWAFGTPDLLRLLNAAVGSGESTAERRVVALLREAGVTGWVLGHRFGPWTLDLAFPALRVALEADGPHRLVAQIRAVLSRRDREVRSAGVPTGPCYSTDRDHTDETTAPPVG